MTTKTELDERYGRTRPARTRLAWAAVAVAAVSVVGYLGWTTVSGTMNDVGVDDLGFEVRGEHEIEVAFQFTAPPGRDVACVLEALDEDFGIVGWSVVRYPAGEGHAQQHAEVVPTVAEATTGLVNSCWVP